MTKGTLEDEWAEKMKRLKMPAVTLEVDKDSFVKKRSDGSERKHPGHEITNMCVNAYATLEFLSVTNSKKSKKAIKKIKKVKCVFTQRAKDCSGDGDKCKMGPMPQPRIEGDTLIYTPYEYSFDSHQTLYYLFWRAYDLGGTCPRTVTECWNESTVHNPKVVGGNKRGVCASKGYAQYPNGNGCSKGYSDKKGWCVSDVKHCRKYKRAKVEGRWIDYGQKKCKGCKLTRDGRVGSHSLRGPYFKWVKKPKNKGPRFGTHKLK